MAGVAAKQTLAPIPAVDWEATLGKTLAPLAGEAFPIARWDVTAVLRSCFVTTAKFIKTVKILTAETDEFVFRRLIHRGNAGEWWEAPSTCTPIQLFKFCMWLRSHDVAVYVNDQRRLRRFMKKAYPGQTVEDVCYLGALEAQLNQLLATEKASRVMLMREKEEELDYTPASAYVPLDELQMGERCYELYKGECERLGEAAEELSLRDVRTVYGNEAAAMHKTEFMRDERRREEVKVWLAKKIIELERVGERRQANNLRFYLITAGGEVSPQVRAAEIEETDIVRTRIRPAEEESIIPAPRRQRLERESERERERER